MDETCENCASYSWFSGCCKRRTDECIFIPAEESKKSNALRQLCEKIKNKYKKLDKD